MWGAGRARIGDRPSTPPPPPGENIFRYFMAFLQRVSPYMVGLFAPFSPCEEPFWGLAPSPPLMKISAGAHECRYGIAAH